MKYRHRQSSTIQICPRQAISVYCDIQGISALVSISLAVVICLVSPICISLAALVLHDSVGSPVQNHCVDASYNMQEGAMEQFFLPKLNVVQAMAPQESQHVWMYGRLCLRESGVLKAEDCRGRRCCMV